MPGGVTAGIKKALRRRYGVWPFFEWRNRLEMGASLPRLVSFENAEVARLTQEIGGRKKARVAVIVPTYKRPELLLVALQSIFAQDFDDYVVMVVDDGAGLPPMPRHPRLTAVSLSQNSKVLGLVRNVGIRLTESDYIAFLDDDNEWTPNHLSLTIGTLEAERLDIVYTALRRRTAAGRMLDILSREFDPHTFVDQTNYVDSNSIVVRRSAKTLFSRLPRKKHTSPKEDWEFVYRQSREGRIRHIPTPTVEYLVNTDSYYTEWAKAD